MTTALVKIEAASKALAEARTIGDVKDIRDRVAAAQHYLRQHGASQDTVIAAGALKVQAERRLGELLAESITRGSHNTKLPEGVQPIQSSRWQRIASIPKRQFDAELARLERKQRSDE